MSPEWVTGEVLLRLQTVEDAEAVARAYARNREHLRQWEPPRPPEFFTPEGQAARLREQLAAHRGARLVPWVLVQGDDVVGTVALSNLAQGPFRSANLRYWIDAEHTGRGLATAAVRTAARIADRELGLHRLEAGTRTGNVASQRVLLECGFERIGVAPDYLYIDGAWRDHLLFQRVLNDRPPETGGRPPASIRPRRPPPR